VSYGVRESTRFTENAGRNASPKCVFGFFFGSKAFLSTFFHRERSLSREKETRGPPALTRTL